MKKTNDTSGLTACIYARYSSHAQNDASIEQQVEKCKEFAERMGLTVVEVYPDRAISGRSDRRPEFQRMMRDSGKGKFSCVIAWKSNRLGRNMLEAMLNDSRLMERGIRCLYVEEDFGDTAAGRFALRSMMNVNQFYSENMAEDISRGLYDNAQQCKVNGVCPLGYKKGADGTYEIDETEAAVVREIYRRIALGETFASIADDLNARHIRTSYGKAWGRNSFHSLTTNERYIGVYKYGDVRIPHGIPPIIDEKLFYEVQEKLRRRGEVAGRRRGHEDFMLTGKLFCGHCGSPMVGYSGTGKSGKMHYYYVCRKRKTEKLCGKENIRKSTAERMIAQVLIDYVLTDDVIEWCADNVMKFQENSRAESQLGYYQEKLAAVRISLNNIMKAIESGIVSTTVQSRMAELETEERALEANVAREQAMLPKLTREQIVYYMRSFRGGDVDDPAFQRKLFDGFLESAYLYDNKLKIVFNYSKGSNTMEVPFVPDDDAEDASTVRLSSPELHKRNGSPNGLPFLLLGA